MVVILQNLKKIVLIFACLIFTNHLKSATCSALASGNWTANAIWSCGHAPTCNDNIVIPPGYTVTITSVIDLTGGGCSNTLITILGQLFMSGNTSRLDLVSTASVVISGTGRLHTDVLNNSQKINIGNGGAEWDSNTGDLTGPWKITNNSSVSTLPVELINFSANCSMNNVLLTWTTASEKNNAYFIIERSSDAVNWENVAKIKSSENSSVLNNYYHLDRLNKLEDNLYYKLSQIDIDGTLNVFKIINANCKNTLSADEVVVYPNPAYNELNLLLNAHINSNNCTINLTDNFGRVVFEEKRDLIQGLNTLSYPIDLQSGAYNLIVSSSQLIIPVKKIIVIKR